MTPTEQPIAPHEPMPHRKVIREWLVPLSEQTTVKALVLLVDGLLKNLLNKLSLPGEKLTAQIGDH